MIPVETIPVIVISSFIQGEKKENGGGVEFMIYCKNFCKCHNVPSA
jgi:hypothetical protein